ncbi:hypothetical protein LTR84_003452 [Exophiala bonariae]|uniref:Uncharacterized protein n=1 Tax=Exophiala bonariae TaxID=1690606 RepID=A0AAV9N861_9EURO|nr:hypothetical protein LTR84_003452 [Exophiala bonariae]
MHSRRGTDIDFGNDQRAYFQALYHDILDSRASQYDNIFIAPSIETPIADTQLAVSSVIEPIVDQESKDSNMTGVLEGFPSETDWSREHFAGFSLLQPNIIPSRTDFVHGLISEQISPPPLSLSSSSASEKETPPVPSNILDLRKIRSNPPQGTPSQRKPRRSSSVRSSGQARGSSRVSKGSVSRPRARDLPKTASHPNQHVRAEERTQPGILKTIFITRKSSSSESFSGITYTPIPLLTLNPADLIASLCRTFSIDPGSIGAVSMWHDPQNGRHGIVDETFLTNLVSDQDIVLDLCNIHENPDINATGTDLREPNDFILLEI